MSPVDGSFLVPRRLRGQYEPLALLKREAARQTLLLRRRDSGGQAVLKRAQAGQEALLEEYGLLRRLAGPGLPAPLEGFREGECAYLLREYVPGECLLDYAQKRGALSVQEVRALGLSLCRTLERLHGQRPPVVHGDVGLESVIRTPAGECVLTSLGAARQGDPRSDVYALGAVLHELASGEARLEEGTVPSALRAVVDGCVRPGLEERYAGAGEVERALTRAGRPWGRFFPRGGRPCK